MTIRTFNLRGTSGTGKTTVAREILRATDAKPDRMAGRKVRSYLGYLRNVPVVVLGSYETTCGGCDTIPSVKIVAELIQDCYDEMGVGIVFFEGLMISHMLGTIGKLQLNTGWNNNVLAFLDTPLQTCIDRVLSRRRMRGIEEDVLPDRTLQNLVKDHRSVERCQQRAIQAGHRVVTIDHQDAEQEVMSYLHRLADEVSIR